MIDLSNNNGTVDFRRVKQSGENRVYLKRSEGHSFDDPHFDRYYRDARAAGLRVGAYHFARPSSNTPKEEADFFLRLAPQLQRGKSMRHCLDLEDPQVKPSPAIGKWAVEWIRLVHAHVDYHPILYSYGSYAEECAFPHVYAWLWLAAYGRNDGREHPFVIPHPWSADTTVAHQYASAARVPGVEGQCDISHVSHPGLVDVRRLHMKHGLHD